MKPSNLPKIENIVVQLLRMDESSGNKQVYLRAKRTDVDSDFFTIDNILEYSCFQTKHGIDLEECIQRAMFEAQFMLRFFGLTFDDVEYARFTEEELKIAKSNLETI